MVTNTRSLFVIPQENREALPQNFFRVHDRLIMPTEFPCEIQSVVSDSNISISKLLRGWPLCGDQVQHKPTYSGCNLLTLPD